MQSIFGGRTYLRSDFGPRGATGSDTLLRGGATFGIGTLILETGRTRPSSNVMTECAVVGGLTDCTIGLDPCQLFQVVRCIPICHYKKVPILWQCHVCEMGLRGLMFGFLQVHGKLENLLFSE